MTFYRRMFLIKEATKRDVHLIDVLVDEVELEITYAMNKDIPIVESTKVITAYYDREEVTLDDVEYETLNNEEYLDRDRIETLCSEMENSYYNSMMGDY